MKKLILVIIGVFLFASLAVAVDNQAKILKYQEEQKKIGQEIEQVEQNIQKLNQYKQMLRDEFQKLQGKIEMLAELDKEAQPKKIEQPKLQPAPQPEGVK